MKLFLLPILLLLASVVTAQNPTVFFSDDFENSSSNWTLDNSVMADSWVVDTNYTGYVMDFLGFPIVVFPDSPEQPSSITGAPRSSYLHVNDPLTCALLAYCNATYSTAGQINATIAQPLDFTGYKDVSVKYSYFVQGHTDSAYAYLEYSLDSITWTQVGNKLTGQDVWTEATVSIPELEEEGNVYFRFAWINLGYSGSNLGIGVDEFKIEGTEILLQSVSNVAMDVSSFCAETASSITVTFNADGIFDPGNTFTAYLSDKDGDFTNAVSIGSITSTANGTLTIYGNLPASAIGTDYKIKVVSSAPSVENTATVLIVINETPVVTATPSTSSINAGESVTLTASGAETYTWSPTNDLNTATGSEVIASPSTTTTYTVTGKNNLGCSATAQATVTVSGLSVSNATLKKMVLYPNPTTENFKIQLEDTKSLDAIKVYTLDGKEMKDFTFSNNTLTINPRGVYFVKLVVDGQEQVLKAIKK